MCFSKKIENGIIFGNPKNRFTSIRIRETAMAVPLLLCSSFDDDWRSKDGRVRQTAKLGSNFNRTTMIKSSCCCYSRFASKMCFQFSFSLSFSKQTHLVENVFSLHLPKPNYRPSEQLNDDIPLLRFSFSPISFFRSQLSNERTNETVDFREQTFREPKQIFRELIVLFF